MSGKCNQCGNNPCVCGENFISSTLLYPGISLRDYFAAKAMQGLLSNLDLSKDIILNGKIVSVAQLSYMYSDSMLEAREK